MPDIRQLYKWEYEGNTLRENLGLTRSRIVASPDLPGESSNAQTRILTEPTVEAL